MKILYVLMAIAVFGCSSSVTKTAQTPPAKAEAASSAVAPPAMAGERAAAANTPAPTPAPTMSPPPGTVVSCTLGTDERLVERIEFGQGCEVKYTKFGESNTIASSTVGPDHCQRVSDQIRSNLEKFGFACK